MIHNTVPYLLNPQHLITVNLIGAGGTGSNVLQLLGRMNEALVGLGHPGIHVRVWDGDTVSAANVGRQLYSPVEVGMNKAVAKINAINRYYGYGWEAHPEHFNLLTSKPANIYLSCVDSAATRVGIAKVIAEMAAAQPYEKGYYWMDFGNSYRSGQVVLGSVGDYLLDHLSPGFHHPHSMNEPPESMVKAFKEAQARRVLPNVLELFPELETMPEEDNQPSCSLAQALGRQDLYINSMLANAGMQLLWNLFRNGGTDIQGMYLNLETMTMNPIKIRP